MRLFNRKSQTQQVLDRVHDSLDAAIKIKSSLPASVGSGKPFKVDVPRSTALKAGLVAGGVAVLTAGSAAISSRRSRREGARDDS